MSILGRWGVQNLGKHIYIILECSPKNLSLKLSLEHFKKFFSPPYFMFYVCFFIFNYYRSLSIGIVLKYHFHYHYHYRSKSHYRTSLDFKGFQGILREFVGFQSLFGPSLSGWNYLTLPGLQGCAIVRFRPIVIVILIVIFQGDSNRQ